MIIHAVSNPMNELSAIICTHDVSVPNVVCTIVIELESNPSQSVTVAMLPGNSSVSKHNTMVSPFVTVVFIVSITGITSIVIIVVSQFP